MAAGLYHFTIEQGAYFERTITVSDNGVARNLTGYIARLQVRTSYQDATPVVDLTTENGGITITTPLEGQLVVRMTAAATAALTGWTNGFYDLELVPLDGKVDRLLQGKVTLSPEVTK